MNYEQLLALAEANTKAIAELRASTAEAHASIVELRASITEVHTSIAELRASITEAHTSIVELRASTAEAHASWEQKFTSAHAQWEQKFAAEEKQRQEDRQRWAEFMQTYGNYVDNQGRKVEDFFIQGIRKNNLRVGALEFDDIFPTATRANKRRGDIEVDALLLNGAVVGILEVKSTLHRNDVNKVKDSLIPRFRELYPEYQDKQLAVLVAGELINPDANDLAREMGFIVLSPNNQDLSVDDSCYRAM